MSGRALVVGVTGISGGNLARRLLADGWQVAGLCRRPGRVSTRGSTPLSADLEDAESVAAAVRGTGPTHVFFTTWSRRATEAENCEVNGRMLQNLLDCDGREESVRHVALVTGLKHYLGPFEAYAKAQPDTPFSEEQPRLPYENFYYVQEDILFEAAERDGFTWSVHRPHTLIGWALGNVMNMGVTLAVYAAICRETGRAFRFPGSREQWEAVTDVTDAGLLPTTSSGQRRRRPPRTRRSTSSTATSSAGGACGRGSLPRWASTRLPFNGEPRSARASRWPTRRRCGRRSCAATACATSTSNGWPRGGTPTRTWAARSRPSPTWAAAGAWAFSAFATARPRSPTLFARLRAGIVVVAMRALRFHAARDLRIEDVAEPGGAEAHAGDRRSPLVRHLRHRPARVHRAGRS